MLVSTILPRAYFGFGFPLPGETGSSGDSLFCWTKWIRLVRSVLSSSFTFTFFLFFSNRPVIISLYDSRNVVKSILNGMILTLYLRAATKCFLHVRPATKHTVTKFYSSTVTNTQNDTTKSLAPTTSHAGPHSTTR